MRIKFLLILLLCGFCFGSVSSKINAVISGASRGGVVFGVQVVDADNSSVVYSYNANKPLIPASNMKIFTTAGAIEILGSDYKFQTDIYFVDGNVIVKGCGDPLLGDQKTLQTKGKNFGWEFDEIVKAVKEKNINKIQNIIVDSSVFDDQLVNPSWPANELNRDYSAEVSGINYNGNCIDINVFPSGSHVMFTKKPDTGYVSLANKASFTREKKNTVWVSRLPNSNKMTLYGKCYSKAVPIQVTVHRPATYFGYILAEKFLSNNINITGSVIEKREMVDADAVQLVRFESTMKDVMTRCNQDSFNLGAEALAKKISAVKTVGRIGGQWKHAGEVIGRMMNDAGIETDGFVFDDGCGLSRKNKVTANMTSQVLLDVYKSENKQFYIDTLAVGGQIGSSPVSRYFKEPQYKGKVFAKSGTISGVKALSGYCYTKNGVFVFSVIVNKANGKSRGAINSIVKAIFDE